MQSERVNNLNNNMNKNNCEKENINKIKIRKRRIRLSFTKTLLMATLLIVSTYAWFTSQHDVTLSNLRGTVEVVENMEISLDAKSWSQKIDLSDALTVFEEAQRSKDLAVEGTAKALLPNLMLPVSGVGELGESIMPLYGGTATGTSLNGIGKYVEENGSEPVDNGYFAFDIYIKNTSKDGEEDILQLNLNSAVQVLTQGVAQVVEGNQLKTFTGKAASGLQNTVRVGLALYEGEVSSTSTQQEILTSTKGRNIKDIAIWEPNASDHVEYIVENNNKLINGSDANKIEFDESEALDTYALNSSSVTATKIDNVYDIASTGLGLQKTFKTEKTSEDDYRVLSLNGKPLNIKSIKEESGQAKDFKITSNTVSRLRVYVWLEGQDVDCINIASEGGGIELDLGLTKDDEVGEVLQDGELNLQTSYELTGPSEVKVTVRSTQELDLPSGWEYEQTGVAKQEVYKVASTENVMLASEPTINKKAIQKTYIGNELTENLEIVSLGGVKEKLQFKILNVSSGSPCMVKTKYSKITPTTGNVTVTIISDVEIGTLPTGWNYTDSAKKEIYKVYTENVDENVTIKNASNVTITTVQVKVSNIVEDINTNDCISHFGIIPEGGKYITVSGTTINEGEEFPETLQRGDIYEYGDYKYFYQYYYEEYELSYKEIITGEWGVSVRDREQTAFGEILGSINGKLVTSLEETFWNSQITTIQGIKIPSTITNMSGTFFGCSNLTTLEGLTIPNGVTTLENAFNSCWGISDLSHLVIPNSVTNLNGTFQEIWSLSSLEGLVIPNSVESMEYTFSWCHALTDLAGLVIPSSVRNMNYTFANLSSASGTITILSNNIESAEGCFENTSQSITLVGNGSNDDVLELLVSTSDNGNVTYEKKFTNEVLGKESTMYGAYTNYPIDIDNNLNDNDWRIFYADSNNVYLIADDCIFNSKIPNDTLTALGMAKYFGKYSVFWPSPTSLNLTMNVNNNFFPMKDETNNFTSTFTTSNNNYKVASALLKTDAWTSLVDSNYAETAIGSPTVEMWMSSWNKLYPENKLYCNNGNADGYYVGTTTNPTSTNIESTVINVLNGYKNSTLYYPHKEALEYSSSDSEYRNNGYWLASPSASTLNTERGNHMLGIQYNGYIRENFYTGYYYTRHFGIRPVVCLKSEITATKNGDVWELEN